MATKLFEIWVEGYAATGDSGTARKLGEYEAESFDGAVAMFEAENPTTKVDHYGPGSYRPGTDMSKVPKYGIWACRFYDNEADARKSFG